MKIVEINATRSGSTGYIMYRIAEIAEKQGNQVYTIFGGRKKEKKYCGNSNIMIGGYFSHSYHRIIGKYTGDNDLLSKQNTKKLIKHIRTINPDIIHLHIVHGNYINYKCLFQFLANFNKPLVWTFHDCWAFTGRCPYFIMTECNKWQNGCYDCPYPNCNYPSALVDKTKKHWNLKKELFCKIQDLTIVTPSNWLARLVKYSFLKDYPVVTINNGIDLKVFRPVKSDFKHKFNISCDYIVLGVANCWDKRKGIDIFIDLAAKLSSNYKIVLVGTNETIDRQLPKNIVSIHRTNNQQELVEIYSAADLFVNPTREDNFPTVNIESLACGTPVLTFDTGGSPEIIDDTCGCVIKQNDISTLALEIEKICETKPYSSDSCLKRAHSFDMNNKYLEYIDLYEKVIAKSFNDKKSNY